MDTDTPRHHRFKPVETGLPCRLDTRQRVCKYAEMPRHLCTLRGLHVRYCKQCGSSRTTKLEMGCWQTFATVVASAATVGQLILNLFPDSLEWREMIDNCNELHNFQPLDGEPMSWAQPCPSVCYKNTKGQCVFAQNADQTTVVFQYRGAVSYFSTITTVVNIIASGFPVTLSKKDRDRYERRLRGLKTSHLPHKLYRLLAVNIVVWLMQICIIIAIWAGPTFFTCL